MFLGERKGRKINSTPHGIMREKRGEVFFVFAPSKEVGGAGGNPK